MKYAVFLAMLFILLFDQPIFSQQREIYSLDKKIQLPGEGGYDYLLVNKPENRLYVSHGSSVNVVDLNKEEFVGSIDSMKGVHGIAIDNRIKRGFISDGASNAVVVFDPVTLKIITRIPLSGKNPDAIIYDPYSNRVFAFNGGSNNVSVVDVDKLKEMGTIELGGAPEFAVADGKGTVYNNLEDKNSMAVFDSKSLKLLHQLPLSPCGAPTGLAADMKNKRLFTVCRDNKGMSVIDMNSGKVIQTLSIGQGVDAVAYDAETHLIFCSNGDGTTTIIQQESANKYAVVQTLQTQVRARTLALDPTTHRLYLSVAKFEPGTRKTIPGSFEVLVFKMN